MEIQVGVKIFLSDRNGKFLLLKRNHLKYPDVKDFWDIPGGRIIPGTPLLDNLKRELLEETGLEFHGKPKLIFAQDIIIPNKKHVVRLTFKGNVGERKELKLDYEEHSDWGWFSIKEIVKIPEADRFVKEITSLNVLEDVLHETEN